MNYKIAKNYIESLIFSSLEPLNKKDLNKMLSEYGNFDLDKILNELKMDYNDRGISLESADNRFFLKPPIV